MKLRHNPYVKPPESAIVSPEYQAEVDRSTEKLSIRYRRAERKHRAAQLRLSKAEKSAKSEKVRAELARLVEMRRVELLEIEAVMTGSPQSAGHRGTSSFRPVPPPGRGF